MDEARRSARPRSLPPRVSTTTQASRATNTTVTMAEPRELTIAGRGGTRHAATAGQTVIVIAPTAVQARCGGVGPPAPTGEAAIPALHSPAMTSRIRAGNRTPVRPAAVAR